MCVHTVCTAYYYGQCMYVSIVLFLSLSLHSKAGEEGVNSPTRPGGFQDFTAMTKAGRKRRTLPIAPQRRGRAEGEEEGQCCANIVHCTVEPAQMATVITQPSGLMQSPREVRMVIRIVGG